MSREDAAVMMDKMLNLGITISGNTLLVFTASIHGCRSRDTIVPSRINGRGPASGRGGRIRPCGSGSGSASGKGFDWHYRNVTVYGLAKSNGTQCSGGYGCGSGGRMYYPGSGYGNGDGAALSLLHENGVQFDGYEESL